VIKKFKVPDTQEFSDSFIFEISSVFNTDGVLILENLIDCKILNKIKLKMEFDLNDFLSGKKWIGGGLIIGHINSRPPMGDYYIYKEVLANEILHKITSTLLKSKSINLDYSANINLPNSTRQSFHSDDVENIFDLLMISIPLGDVNIENGSTEFIPKTHKLKFNKNHAKTFLSLHADTLNGSAIIWRPSTWHRGSYNPSKSPRIMLNLKHTALNSNTHKKTPPLNFSEKTIDRYKNLKEYVNCASKEPIEEDSVFSKNYFNTGLLGITKEIIYKYKTIFNDRK
jgi:hypothetical protein